MIVEPAPDDDKHPDLDNFIHAQLLLDVWWQATTRPCSEEG